MNESVNHSLDLIKLYYTNKLFSKIKLKESTPAEIKQNTKILLYFMLKLHDPGNVIFNK